MAAAEAQLAATYNKPGFEIFNNHTYVILGDGCLQEGVASEACSLAGHLKLGKLIAFYDDNHITIDGDTGVSFTEDVLKRFEAYDWHVQTVGNGDSDYASIEEAIKAAQKVTDKPSIIKVRTTIGMYSFYSHHRVLAPQRLMCHTILYATITQILTLFFSVRLWFLDAR